MPDSKEAKPRKAEPDESAAPQMPPPETSADDMAASQTDEIAPTEPAPESAPATPAPGGSDSGDPARMVRQQARPASPAAAAEPTGQVIDLDAARADERKATLAYVAKVHELRAIARPGRPRRGLFHQGDTRGSDPPRAAQNPCRRGRGHRHSQPGVVGHGRAGAARDRHRGDLRRPQPERPLRRLECLSSRKVDRSASSSPPGATEESRARPSPTAWCGPAAAGPAAPGWWLTTVPRRSVAHRD
jgi:hypothetical protein